MIPVVDGILCLVVAEAAALLLLHRLTGHGLRQRQALGMLLPGFFLLLAMRLAIGGSPWFVVCGVLFLALCTHLGDLASRWS